MTRLSVGRDIARAYGFLFGRIATVVSISWVAAALYAAMRMALLEAGPVPRPFAAHLQIAALQLGGLAAGLLLLAALAVPLTRAALGEREDWALAHFVIGARELRLFLALLRLAVILIGVIAICTAGVVGVGIGAKAALAHWPALAKTGFPIEAVLRGVAVALAVAATIYAALRLSFLLFAVAAVEPHASLKRAWTLAGGHVLGLFVIVLAIVVPVYALAFAGEYALVGGALLDALQRWRSSAPPDVDALMAQFAAHAEAIGIGAALLLVVMAALGAGASAAVYRALTGTDAQAPDEAAAQTHDMAEHATGHDASAHEEPEHDAPVHEDAAHEEPAHEESAHEEPAHEAHGQEEPVQAHEPHPGEEAHGHDDAHGHDEAHGHDDVHAHAAGPADDAADSAVHLLTDSDVVPDDEPPAAHAAAPRVPEHA